MAIQRYGRWFVEIRYAGSTTTGECAASAFPYWASQGWELVDPADQQYVDDVPPYDPSIPVYLSEVDSIVGTLLDDPDSIVRAKGDVLWGSTGTVGSGAVDSVNGLTGQVVLDADDLADGVNHLFLVPTERTLLDGLQAQLDGKAAAVHTHTSADVSDFTEAVQDAVAALLQAGTGVTVSYDDAAGTLVLTSTATGGSTDPEVVRDTIGVALAGVGLIGVAVDDAGDTITITTTATQNSTDAALRDRSTHTGTQTIDTIAGLQAALDAKAPTVHSHATADVTGLDAALAGKVDTADVGVAGGIAPLGADGLVPASYLPPLSGGDVTQAEFDALQAQVSGLDASQSQLMSTAASIEDLCYVIQVDSVPDGAGGTTLTTGSLILTGLVAPFPLKIMGVSFTREYVDIPASSTNWMRLQLQKADATGTLVGTMASKSTTEEALSSRKPWKFDGVVWNESLRQLEAGEVLRLNFDRGGSTDIRVPMHLTVRYQPL